MDGDQGGIEPRPSGVLEALPRRLVLLGGGAAVLALLVDGGLRLDLPQPPPPVPTRRPAPDEDLLLDVVADLTALVDAETSLVSSGEANALVRRLRTVQREQRRVLVGRLTNDGVPTQVVDAAVRAARPGTTVRTRRQLADRLADVPAELWGRIAGATPSTRELLTAAYAVRLAGAQRLGVDVAVRATPSPARPAVVARTQPLVYAFEVAAAQSADDVRTRAEGTLAALNRLDVAVSGASTDPPAGWSLPYPVTSPSAAERLAHDSLATAVDATVDAAGPAPTGASVEDVARWSARVQSLAVPWGLPLTAFPGATA